MGRRLVGLTLLTLVTLVSLTGCDASSQDRDVPSRAESLWSSRVQYLGDNSRVAALVQEVGPAPEGSYTISLQTAKPPYALTLDFERLPKPFEATDFSEPATLLLALVSNLGEVSVTAGGQAYSLTAAAASQDLGYDVKELGRDQGRLREYLDADTD